MKKTGANFELEPARQGVDHQLPSRNDRDDETGPAPMTGAHSVASSPSYEELKADRDALLDRLARMQAEFENARKRTAREQQEFKESALADALTSLLPVLDSFELALKTPAQNVEEMRSGVDLIRKQLRDVLGKLGLKPISAKDQPFDPHLHEAVESVDTNAAQENHVLAELRPGYKLGTRLLRPAMVAVAHNPKEEHSGRG
jgi:molecular chaperone GrpE